jgi:hypothetical protein
MESIQTLLDERLIKEQKESTREPITGPSQLGSCLRQLMLMEKGFKPRPFEPITLRIFKAGYIFEEFLLGTLEKAGKLVERQKKVEYRGIRGTLDAVANLNGENVLFDCKSIKGSAFKYLDEEGVGENYIYQLSFYHKALSQSMKLSPIGRIFYVEKENMMVKELPVMCVENYPLIEKKISEIEVARKSKELPPERDTKENTYPCYSVNKKFKTCKEYCQYSDHCPKIKSEVKSILGGFEK